MQRTKGIGYRTVGNHYNLGLIPNARKLPTEELIKQLAKEDDHS